MMWHFLCVTLFGVASANAGQSLIQRRIQGAQMLEGSGQSDGSSARHVALAGFEKYATELTQKVVAHDLEMTEAEKEAMQTIFDFIDSMYADLVVGHDSDLILRDGCETQLDLCKTRREDADTEAKKLAVSKTEYWHDKCRLLEKNQTETKKQLCQDYEDYRKSVDARPPSCIADDINYTKITADKDSQDLKDFETCLNKTKTWLDPLWAHYANCSKTPSPTPTPTPGPIGDCQTEQNALEDNACIYALLHDSRCTAWDKCYEQEKVVCDDNCASLMTSVNARKADNETAERIKCLLHVLNETDNAKKPDMLGNCTNATYNTTIWNIPCYPYPYPPPVPPDPCSPPALAPCEDAWKNQYYYNKNWSGNNVTLHECQSCPHRVVENQTQQGWVGDSAMVDLSGANAPDRLVLYLQTAATNTESAAVMFRHWKMSTPSDCANHANGVMFGNSCFNKEPSNAAISLTPGKDEATFQSSAGGATPIFWTEMPAAPWDVVFEARADVLNSLSTSGFGVYKAGTPAVAPLTNGTCTWTEDSSSNWQSDTNSSKAVVYVWYKMSMAADGTFSYFQYQ